MIERILDGAGVYRTVFTQDFSDILASRPPANAVDRERVTAARYMKRDLAAPADRGLFRNELVDLGPKHGSAGLPAPVTRHSGESSMGPTGIIPEADFGFLARRWR